MQTEQDKEREERAASAFRDDAFKWITLPSGREVKIQRVPRMTLMADGHMGPVLIDLDRMNQLAARNESAEQKAERVRANATVVQAVIRLGLVVPRIAPDRAVPGVNGTVPYSCIGTDEDELQKRILEFSGWTEEASRAASFRDSQPPSPATPADGAALGEAPTGAPA